jgi:hypothetical protein
MPGSSNGHAVIGTVMAVRERGRRRCDTSATVTRRAWLRCAGCNRLPSLSSDSRSTRCPFIPFFPFNVPFSFLSLFVGMRQYSLTHFLVRLAGLSLPLHAALQGRFETNGFSTSAGRSAGHSSTRIILYPLLVRRLSSIRGVPSPYKSAGDRALVAVGSADRVDLGLLQPRFPERRTYSSHTGNFQSHKIANSKKRMNRRLRALSGNHLAMLQQSDFNDSPGVPLLAVFDCGRGVAMKSTLMILE